MIGRRRLLNCGPYGVASHEQPIRGEGLLRRTPQESGAFRFMSSSGGVLSNFMLVPLIWFIGSHLDSAIYPATGPMPPDGVQLRCHWFHPRAWLRDGAEVRPCIGVASARLWIWNAMGLLADLESDTASAV